MSDPVIIKKSYSHSPLQVNEGENIKSNVVLLFLIFLIPLQNIYITKLPSLGGGLNLLNICFLVAFIVWKARPDLNSPTSTSLNKPVLFFMLSILFALIMRLVTLGSLDFAVMSTAKDILLAPFLFFIVLNSVRDRRGILMALGATILPMIYMFRVFYSQHRSVVSTRYDHDLRISGTFSQLGSNEIATFYSAYTILVLALLFYIKDVKVRMVLLLVSVLNLYSLVYSYSRGAYIGFLIGLFAIIWHTRKSLVLILIPAMFIFGGIAINFLPYSVQERVESIFVEDESKIDESTLDRFTFWGIAMDQFYKSPLVGHGYLTFIEANPYNMDTHNYYLKLLAEQGIIGFIIFIVILWRAAKLGRSLYDESEDPVFKAIGISLFGIVACLAFGNIFGDRYTHYPLSAYFYVYLALGLRALILTRENSPARSVLKRRV